MESLYLLIPLSIVLVLGIAGVLVWAVMSGQFENMEQEGTRILDEADDVVTPDQSKTISPPHADQG
jgi:cbb3-type cytochrome oxidase maturation protein